MSSKWRDDLDVWASPILANMMWVVLTIPIITMPLGLVGLMASLYYWGKNRQTQVFTIFFNTIRKTWLKAYMLFIVDVLIGAFIVLNLLIFLRMELNSFLPFVSLGATMFTLIVFLCASVHAWVLVAVWDAPFIDIVKTAVKLVFISPFWSALTALGFVAPIVVSLVFPAAVFITVTGALAATLATRGTMMVLYMIRTPGHVKLLDLTV